MSLILTAPGCTRNWGSWTWPVKIWIARSIYPTDRPSTTCCAAVLRHQQGDLDASHSDADQALRFAPEWMLTFPEVFHLNFKGHLDWALDYYWRAIERMPRAYQAYMGRADACRTNERYDWAIADYDRAAALAPRRAEIYLARGKAYQQLTPAGASRR